MQESIERKVQAAISSRCKIAISHYQEELFMMEHEATQQDLRRRILLRKNKNMHFVHDIKHRIISEQEKIIYHLKTLKFSTEHSVEALSRYALELQDMLEDEKIGNKDKDTQLIQQS